MSYQKKGYEFLWSQLFGKYLSQNLTDQEQNFFHIFCVLRLKRDWRRLACARGCFINILSHKVAVNTVFTLCLKKANKTKIITKVKYINWKNKKWKFSQSFAFLAYIFGYFNKMSCLKKRFCWFIFSKRYTPDMSLKNDVMKVTIFWNEWINK